MAVPPVAVRAFLAKSHLPRVSHLSVSKDDKIPGAVDGSPGIYLTTEEGCATSHHFKWDPLPPNEVDRTALHVREGEGKK